MMTTFGLRDGGDVAVLRNHRPQRFDQFVRVDVLRGDHSRDQFFTGDLLGFVQRTAALFGERLLLNAHDAARLDRRETVHPQHRKEQFVDVVLVQAGVGDDGDFAFDARIDDEGLAGDRGDLRDELVDVGVLEVDLPGLFLGEPRLPATISMTDSSPGQPGAQESA